VAESSTGTWTTVWTDLLTDLDRYRVVATILSQFPNEDNQYICYVAILWICLKRLCYQHVDFNCWLTCLNKALKALRLEDLRVPVAYLKTFKDLPRYPG